jgi:hypothetical protein
MRKFWKENIENAIAFEETQPSPSASGHPFVEVTDPAEIKQLYLTQYAYRTDDGQDYISNFTADRYIDVINGVYTEAEVFALESHIKDLYSALSNGWWLTAQNINQNLILDGIYDAAMKSSIQTTLDTYISDNY